MGSRLAVAGATGAVGRTMLSILEERDFPVSELRVLASARSAGSKISTRWGEAEVEDLALADPSGVDIALFSAGGDRSRAHAPRFAAAGAVVVDNSSAFRRRPDVPLVTAGVNDHAVAGHAGLIANPNCTTMGLLMAVAPLHRRAGLARMVVASYQSVSGSGMTGMETLLAQTGAFLEERESLTAGGWTEPETGPYQRPIGFNVLPLAGAVAEQGYTDEEWKLVHETRKILERDDIAVEATCVRTPVLVGHGASAVMWFDRPLSPEEAAAALGEAPGVEVWSDDRVPTPLDAAGADNVLAGRIRATVGEPGGISLWAVSDNLRKGAALNAVQIAEMLL